MKDKLIEFINKKKEDINRQSNNINVNSFEEAHFIEREIEIKKRFIEELEELL